MTLLSHTSSSAFHSYTSIHACDQSEEVAALYQGLSWVTYTCGALLSSCASGVLLEHMGPRPVLIAASAFLLLDAGCAALISEAGRKPTQPSHQQAGSSAWRWCSALGGGRPLAQPQQGSAGSGVHEGSSVRASLTADQMDECQPLLSQGLLPPQPMEGPGCATTVSVLLPPPSYPVVLAPATMQHTDGQPACCPSPQLAVAGLLDGQEFGRRVEAMGLRGKLCQSTPNPSTALFYWQTSVLGFSPGFMQLVYLCGTLSGFAADAGWCWLLVNENRIVWAKAGHWLRGGRSRRGLLVYNLALVRVNIRTLLLCCAVLGYALNALLLLQVSRVSVRLGIDDKLFALCDYSILYAIAETVNGCRDSGPMLNVATRVVFFFFFCCTWPSAKTPGHPRGQVAGPGHQPVGESMRRPLEMCSWKGLEALPASGEEYQQCYKLVNDRLLKVRQRLHRAAEHRRGISCRARDNP
ncbi:hypothetical protein QJQ45_009659 [Haematococcus lacustris]|nr:hypothetical protein QJQ45_009659 [Haematococcus lacustris]